MPLFMTDSELEKERANVDAIVSKADAFVRALQEQVETQKARADATAINAEQTCALIEQKFLILSGQFSQLENEKEQSFATLERRSTELAQAQGQIHKLEIEAIKHNSATERLSTEVGELTKSKRELLDVIEQKNLELDEKNSSIRTYLNKVVELTDERSILEGKLHEHEAEVVRARAALTRISQEKELVEQHNAWLNEELTAKVDTLLEERNESAQTESNLKTKLAEAERTAKEASEALQRSKEHNLELEAKLKEVREDLKYLKEDSAIKDEQFAAEVATAGKLVELYKESTDDWSKKSHELEGVIKALETHLSQVEADYKEKLGKEQKAREEAEKEAAATKEKLEKILVEVNADAVKTKDSRDFLSLADKPYTGPIDGQLALEFPGDGDLIPVVPSEVSGTALAAALLRDGWSLAKMYSKYQEAVDAWRHERQERQHSQALLERVLHEIELRAEVIMDERVAHNQMVEAYHKMEEKLHQYLEDQTALDNACKDMKAELRKRERELNVERKEKEDLQTQVAVLLKECSDVQHRFGIGEQNGGEYLEIEASKTDITSSDAVISERLLTFKDIRGMVEQNSQLRKVVRTLGQQNEHREKELKEEFEAELKRRLEEISRKVAETVKKSEEQSDIIERLHGTVGMYRRLYEEQMHQRRTQQNAGVPALASGNSQDLRKLLDSSQEEIGKMREEATSRVKELEEELSRARQEITTMRVEGARTDAEASFARDQLASLMRETENQRKEMEIVLARNMEFSQTITDYQRRLREGAQKLQAAEDVARRRSIEASVTEREKELLAAAEKRASEEVATLSERVHRLQAALDTIHTAEEARESVRAAEKKRMETELNNLQKEWAEARKELEVEREHGRHSTSQRDRAVSEALKRVEAVSKELADAMKAVSAAETRAQVAEARCVDLESSLKKADDKIMLALGGSKTLISEDGVAVDVDGEIMLKLQQTKEELERVKEDLAAAKIHTEQYKKIADANEEALKQMEEAYSSYKDESERRREALESEVAEQQKRLSELEVEVSEKDKAAGVASEEKDKALTTAFKEIASLKEFLASKDATLMASDEKISTLKDEVEKLRKQWREAQNNYEKQVLRQADTIRDLTTTSEKLSSLEEAERSLRDRAESAEAELGTLHVKWAMEKSSLESAKLEADKKIKELDEQNQILLDRLEGMHIVAAESERKASSAVTEGAEETSEVQGESDLQNVIRYLRRSKETVDMELTLMKQERVRLQKQLEGAYRAAEEAQTSLRREHESARASLYSDEEFRTLQTQVRELNLLRESNAELREENKKSFEDAREWRDKTREAQAELEPLRKRLREKEVDLEASARTLESQKAQTQRWEKRVTQLLEKYKAVDLDEYQRVKTELTTVQDREKATSAALESARKEIQDFKNIISKNEEEKQARDAIISGLEKRVAELDQKLQEALHNESKVTMELTRFKKHAAFQKKKIDDLNKEKDDLTKTVENYKKQNEELRTSGRRHGGDQLAAKQFESRLEQAQKEYKDKLEQNEKESAARQEQMQRENEIAIREKETRIQVLEKALEREKEEAKREKARRMKNDKAYLEFNQKTQQDKKKVMEDLDTLKLENEQYHAQLVSAGLLTDPIPKAAEREETGATNIATLQPMIEEVAPETSTAAAPAASSSTSALPSSTTTTAVVVESPLLIEPTQITAVVVEPPSTFAEPATGMPIPPIAPSSVVPAAPAVIPVPPPSSSPSNVVGGPISVPPSRPPLRSTSSTGTTAPARPRVLPIAPVVTPPTSVAMNPDREREMNQLRARILEQENKRKTRPRLIRPRIEPLGASTSNMEGGDGAQEGALEMADTDVEAVAPAISEVPDNAGSPSTTAVAEAVVTTTPAEAPVMVAPPATAVSVARKRAAPAQEVAPSDDELVLQENKSEKAPPQKKSRPAEDTITEDPYSFSGVQTNAQPAVAAEPTDTAAMPEPVGHRPIADTSEAPASKKPRFGQVSEPVSAAAPPQSLDASEAIDLTKKELEEPLQEVGTEPLEVSDMPIVSELLNDIPVLMDSMPATPLETHASDTEQLMDLMGNAVEEALEQYQRIGNDSELTTAVFTEAIATTTTTTTTAVVEEEITIMTETVVTDTEPQNMDEAEEGEIVTENVEDVTIPPPEVQAPPEVKPESTPIEVPTTANAERAPEAAPAAAAETAPVESEASIPSTPEPAKAEPAKADDGAEEPESESGKGTEVASGHRTRLATGTVIRPSPGRGGTTINLADRAKERAALRQAVVDRTTPVSPTTRGRGRGRAKRGTAAGRGRMVSTGRGELSGTPPPTGPSGTNAGEQSQQQSTNPSKDNQS